MSSAFEVFSPGWIRGLKAAMVTLVPLCRKRILEMQNQLAKSGGAQEVGEETWYKHNEYSMILESEYFY